MAQLTESDKALISFQSQNPTALAYILVTSEAVPIKYEGLSYQEVVKYTGLIYDLVLFSKKSLDDLKKGEHTKSDHLKEKNPQFSMRLRLKNGIEILVVQEADFYLITLQICKATAEEPKEGEKKN